MLQDLLASQVIARGSGEAIVSGDRRMSFAALDEASTRLGAALADRGVRPGDRVVMLLPDCTEFVVVFLGIVKAGAIAVPVDTRFAAPEVGCILGDCAPRVAFIHSTTSETFGRAAVPVRNVFAVDGQDFGPLVSLHPRRRIALPAGLEACVICYAPGSAGKPVGTVLTHADCCAPEPGRQLAALGGMLDMLRLGSTLVIPTR